MVEQIMNIRSPESLMRARLEASAQPHRTDAAQVSFGAEALDARLGGGLVRAALHEVYAGANPDAASAAAFALLLAWRAGRGRPIFWVREEASARIDGKPYGHGLAELGIPPNALILVNAPNSIAALRAGADIMRCSAVSAVIIEPIGKAPALDLTASRRLALAAGQTGVMTLVLRTGAEPVPSAAHTRWQVASAPSTPLPANAPGHPIFDVTLLRHRGGIAGIEARLEWNRDRQSFDQAPLPGGVPAVAFGGTGQAVERRAA
jgi:protein ImuA